MLRLRFTHVVVSAGLLLGVTTIVAAPAAAAPAAPASAQYYTVQSGDYLMGIAAKLDVRLSDLLAANNLTVTSLIYPGMQLVVPGAAAATPSAPVTQYYTVARGDYLTGIAVKLSVKLSALLEANGLTIQSVILPGQRLVVPAGGSLPSAPSSSSSSSGSGASPAAVSTAAQPLQYTVVAGDYLSCISLKLKVKLADLLTLNRLTTTSLIYPGMHLQVPPGGVLPAAPASSSGGSTAGGSSGSVSSDGLIYVVRSGDSLSRIAGITKVSLHDLLEVNHLTVSSLILPGQRLAIPAGGVLPSPSSSAASSASGALSAKVATVLDFAMAQQGKPYAFNTAGPDTFDCSGLTLAAFAKIGINLPHYSGYQVRYGTAVDWGTQDIRPGDLVFLESYPGSGVINHVGIAVSATEYIHAPRTGDVVRVGSIPFYRVVAVRRLVQD